ncbi:MAG: hypothetical protein ACOC9T_00050 [Myxococcota bacterium]
MPEYREGTRVYITTDKHGREIAYREGGLRSGRRMFRMKLEDAKLGIATGHYVQGGTFRPMSNPYRK